MHTIDHALKLYIAVIRAGLLWFHGAHLASRGAGFSGDHTLLFTEIYEYYEDQLDSIIEKAIGLTEDECYSSPVKTTEMAIAILKSMPEPHQTTALATVTFGLQFEEMYLEFVEDLFGSLEDQGELSLGLNDFLAADANKHESFVYKLRQRSKSQLEN